MEDEEAQDYIKKIMEYTPDGDKDSYFKQMMENDAVRDQLWHEPGLTMGKEDKRWEKRKVNQEIAERKERELAAVEQRMAEEEQRVAALKELEIAREKANKERDENEGRPEWGIF